MTGDNDTFTATYQIDSTRDDDLEEDVDYKIRFYDPAGNPQYYGSESDLPVLVEKSLHVDTISPEINSLIASTNNDGMIDSDRPLVEFARVGDNLTLSFKTDARLLDNGSDQLRYPEVYFLFGGDNRSATVTGDNDTFTATYQIDSTRDDNLEEDVDYRIRFYDPAGNPQYYGSESDLPVSVEKSLHVDTISPEINSLIASTNNDGMIDSDRPLVEFARVGDNLTLSFRTDARLLDNGSDQLRYPEVYFLFGGDNRSATVTGANDTFTATYQIDSTRDDDLEEDVDYRIRFYDPAGNPQYYGSESDLPVLVEKSLHVDTISPEVTSLIASTNNDGMIDSDRPLVEFARVGDNLTLSFQTVERLLDNGSDQLRYPEVYFLFGGDNRSATVTGANDTFTATYQIDSTRDDDLEEDVDYKIRFYDPAGNPQYYGSESDLPVLVEKSLHVDTISPEINSLIASTNNDGMIDSDRPSVEFARVGDNLTLSFKTDARLLDNGSDQLRYPEVYFLFGGDNRSATVTGDNDTFTATYQIDSTRDDNLEEDVDYKIRFYDPAGNPQYYGSESDLPVLVEKSLHVDTISPEINSLIASTNNDGMIDSDRPLVEFARVGDNLTLSFKTDARLLDNGSDQLRYPEVYFLFGGDNRSATVTGANDTFTATYQIDSTRDDDLEEDVDYKIRFYDPAGNPQYYGSEVIFLSQLRSHFMSIRSHRKSPL